jgi:hypothetical protein
VRYPVLLVAGASRDITVVIAFKAQNRGLTRMTAVTEREDISFYTVKYNDTKDERF